MKNVKPLLSGVVFLVLFSCQKNSPARSTSHNSLPAAFSVPLTHQQALDLNAWIAEGKATTPFDFLAAVNAIKSQEGSHTAVEPTGGSYTPAQDEDYDQALDILDYPSSLGAEDYSTHTTTVYSSFQENLTFPIRKNSIQVVVPFQYSWGILASAGTNTITNIKAYTPIQLLPVGGYWGSVAQGTTNYINGGPGSSPWQQSAGINAYANAQETRTQITSTTGQIEISTNANAGVFQVGAKLGASFTIQGAINIFNQYTMAASGQIWIEGETSGYGAVPTTQYQGTVLVVDNGILQNQ